MIREKVVDPETGEEFVVGLTRSLVEELQKHGAHRCQHPKTKLCRSTMSDGREEIRRQCLECGELVGTAVAKKDAPSSLKPFEIEFRDRCRKAWEDARAAIKCKHARLQRDEKSRFSKEYNAYLKTLKWQEIRNKVLNRAGGLCEGCRERAPSQVHHLTYDNFQNEFLFELVALCGPCHTRYHEDDNQASVVGEVIDDEDDILDQGRCYACRWGPPEDKNGEEWCWILEMSVQQAQQGDDPCSQVTEPLK